MNLFQRLAGEIKAHGFSLMDINFPICFLPTYTSKDLNNDKISRQIKLIDLSIW